ncbi:O-methyltransferase-like protein [Xylaria flabelliformis]|nr:O-methyltransferase-like protein [Xylaria flabelliformis]
MAPRTDELAATISASIDTITNYLDQHSLPHPSFDADRPMTLSLSPYYPRCGPLNELEKGVNKAPLEGTISFTGLAETTDIAVNDLKRIVRFAMSCHRLFTEPQEGSVAHSAGSKKLAIDNAMFVFLRTQPSKADRFSKAIRLYSAGRDRILGILSSRELQLNSLGAGVVVDVGGADVEDLPDFVAAAEQAWLTGRVRYQAHDFFSTQRVVAADVYLFRWVFHDHYVVRISRAQVPALRKGARILVN